MLTPCTCAVCVVCCPAEASKQLRVPMPFLTTIIVPIVGNAAEHASALMFAIKNRMEISLGVAMGECMLRNLGHVSCCRRRRQRR